MRTWIIVLTFLILTSGGSLEAQVHACSSYAPYVQCLRDLTDCSSTLDSCNGSLETAETELSNCETEKLNCEAAATTCQTTVTNITVELQSCQTQQAQFDNSQNLFIACFEDQVSALKKKARAVYRKRGDDGSTKRGIVQAFKKAFIKCREQFLSQ